MDTIAEKFSLYDFVGIWGPGAVTVTYYLFTTRSFFREFFAGNMCLKKAYLCLKYDEEITTRRVDTYHSIYGLSRSLSVAFILHIAIVIISNLSAFDSVHILLLLIDVALVLIFYCKAYRFYMNWIKNTYVQYYLCIYKNEKRKKK